MRVSSLHSSVLDARRTDLQLPSCVSKRTPPPSHPAAPWRADDRPRFCLLNGSSHPVCLLGEEFGKRASGVAFAGENFVPTEKSESEEREERMSGSSNLEDGTVNADVGSQEHSVLSREAGGHQQVVLWIYRHERHRGTNPSIAKLMFPR